MFIIAQYRIAKFISACGYCSRREAEKLILANRVFLNKQIINDLAIKVDPEDQVLVNDKLLTLNAEMKLWLYHKPSGMITTHYDPQGRRTVFNSLPDYMPRVVSVGRLDYNSEGLLLLTNSGALAHALEKPNKKIIRKYKCRISGILKDSEIKRLAQGIVIDGFRYGSIIVRTIKIQGSNSWVMVSLYEGKNREIRRAMRYFGLEVSRLIRLQYGKFVLRDLKKEGIIEVEKTEFTEYLL